MDCSGLSRPGPACPFCKCVRSQHTSWKPMHCQGRQVLSGCAVRGTNVALAWEPFSLVWLKGAQGRRPSKRPLKLKIAAEGKLISPTCCHSRQFATGSMLPCRDCPAVKALALQHNPGLHAAARHRYLPAFSRKYRRAESLKVAVSHASHCPNMSGQPYMDVTACTHPTPQLQHGHAEAHSPPFPLLKIRPGTVPVCWHQMC